MENNASEQSTVETQTPKEQHSSESKLHEDILMDDSVFLSRTIFKKLARKYNKKLGREATEIELIELIRQDLVTKRQNSLIIKEYFKEKFWREFGLLVMAAFSITIVFDYFVTTTGATGIFPAGVGAIARFCATVSFTNSPSMVSSFFFVYQFALNVPLMIFGIFKLGWKFTISTVLYMVLQIAFDQVLQLIPVINPNDFHIIIDLQFIQSLDSSWNFAIWLFIFGIVGGALMGWSYSLVYRMGGSTGGTDFITVWISKKNSKPVGSINRNVNFLILGIVIISNTAILDPSRLNHDIIIRELGAMDWNVDVLRNGTHDTINTFLTNVYAGSTSGIDLTGDHTRILEQLLKDRPEKFNELADIMPKKVEVLLKLQFIVGPSLFGSLTLIVVSGICTNVFYPKYKLRTFMISTNLPKEVNKKIIELGFQNEIVSWDTTNRSRGNYLHRTMFMISMPVMQWREIQRELFTVDPYMKVTIMRTKAVVGLFKYEPVQNVEREEFLEKVTGNETEIEKIKQIAIVKFKAQLELSNERRKKLMEDIKSGGDKKRRAEREIKRMKKRRDEMIVRFRQNIAHIDNMDNEGPQITIVDAPKKEEKE